MSTVVQDLQIEEQERKDEAERRFAQVVLDLANEADVDSSYVRELLTATGKSAAELSEAVSERRTRNDLQVKLRGEEDKARRGESEAAITEANGTYKSAIDRADAARHAIVYPLQVELQRLNQLALERVGLDGKLFNSAAEYLRSRHATQRQFVKQREQVVAAAADQLDRAERALAVARGGYSSGQNHAAVPELTKRVERCKAELDKLRGEFNEAVAAADRSYWEAVNS